MKTRKKRGKPAQKWARYGLKIDSVKDLLAANRGLLQAASSWSLDACCAGNDCCRGESGDPCWGDTYCYDRASSSDWLFGLWPGPPQRFEPTGTDTIYQRVGADHWPYWGNEGDLIIGAASGGEIGCARSRRR